MPENLAPTWDVVINGSIPLPEGVRALVQSLEVEASVDGSDELTIKALAYDPTGTVGARWAIVGSTLLAPGNFLTVYAGYQDGAGLKCLQRFRVVSQEVDYQAGNVPTVTIRAYSSLSRLAEATDARAWEGPIADSTIVQELAEAHGLELDADPTEERTKGRVKPRGESDLLFIRKLAVAAGYGPPVVRWDDDRKVDVLTFKAQYVDTSKALTFTLDPVEAGADLASGNLLSFRAALDLHGVPTHILVMGWDPAAQAPVVVTMAIGAEGQDPVILTGDQAKGYGITKGGSAFQAKALADSDDPRDRKLETLALPSTVDTVEDAIRWATRWINLRNAAFLTGEATILGHPDVWTGQVHRFQGLAEIHVGLWELLTARHRFGPGGYTVSLDLGRVLEDQSEPEEA